MTINVYELKELLTGEITSTRITGKHNTPCLEIEYGDEEIVALEHMNDQTFWVTYSNADDIYHDSTISVDELLDIVL
jgi:hypothetical protein